MVNVEVLEPQIHSFIVKVWVDEASPGDRRTRWHGQITHVPGGERHYLRDLNCIAAVIAPYLEQMGVKLGLRWRVRQRWNAWKQRLRVRNQRR